MPGRYDFTYLRVDFNNQCNVGYGFINFLAPEDVVDFMKIFQGRNWNIPSCPKVAEVTFADDQGAEQFVERLRNSAVTAQWGPFRPKTYYSANDLPDHHPIVIGREKPFPGITNRERFIRSMATGPRVGLYPPRESVGHRRVLAHTSEGTRRR